MTERSELLKAFAVLYEDQQVSEPLTGSVQENRVETANYRRYRSNLMDWQEANVAYAVELAHLAQADQATRAAALEPLQRAADQAFDEFRMSEGIADIEMALTVCQLLSEARREAGGQ
ncbi:hypothetical protein Mycsm_05232 [Mycobacterium sp. JS623]|uniref:hypothetical protein n=1 Tax=Mycobacterium sp. JS623 TaxID=212767 RepID=UPI0002A57EB3|nr:hypothetical protein [Mycobacterium sp. JS623]AGB25433.1 hypothetical protein Mycsm_05232 [Mycobacterium sp. JS623]